MSVVRTSIRKTKRAAAAATQCVAVDGNNKTETSVALAKSRQESASRSPRMHSRRHQSQQQAADVGEARKQVAIDNRLFFPAGVA